MLLLSVCLKCSVRRSNGFNVLGSSFFPFFGLKRSFFPFGVGWNWKTLSLLVKGRFVDFGIGVGTKVNSVPVSGVNVVCCRRREDCGLTVGEKGVAPGVGDSQGTAVVKMGTKSEGGGGCKVEDMIGACVEEMRMGLGILRRSSRVGTIIGGGSMVGLSP